MLISILIIRKYKNIKYKYCNNYIIIKYKMEEYLSNDR
jgi:hypothetical protein